MKASQTTSHRDRPFRRRLELDRCWVWGFVVFILASTCFVDAVFAKKDKGDKRNRQAPSVAAPNASQPVAGGPAATIPFSKAIALQSVIGALGANHSDSSQKALEQLVTGEIDTGAHAKQAAQLVLLQFALQPTPPAEAFLLRIFTDPDEKIRPGDKGIYPAADLRSDAAQILAKVGSPKVRFGLAKVYTQGGTSPQVRAAIEEIVRSPSPANFESQMLLFQDSKTPKALRDQLEQILLEKNASACKQALRIDEDAAKDAGGTPFASPFGPPSGAAGNSMQTLAAAVKMLGAGGAVSAAAAKPTSPASPTPAGANTVAPAQAPSVGMRFTGLQGMKVAGAAGLGGKGNAALLGPKTPQSLVLDMMEQILERQPVDPATVANALWKSDFAASLVKQLAGGGDEEDDDKVAKKSGSASTPQLVAGLASIPLRGAREDLKTYLHKKWRHGPDELGKVDSVAATTGTPAATKPRRRKKGDDDAPVTRNGGARFNFGNLAMKVPGSKKQLVEFGNDWFDPGSLVVLKTIPYEERPKEKARHHSQYPNHNTTNPFAGRKLSAAGEKRAKEREAKAKAQEAKYEWRDAVEKSVRQWNDRLNAVAESPADGVTNNEASDSDGKEAATKPTAKTTATTASTEKLKSATAKKSASAVSKSSSDEPTPMPSTAMLFALQTGGKIVKEFHTRWPQDLPAGLGSTINESLAVDYVRLEGQAEFNKTFSHYQNVITTMADAKTRKTAREIENGKWLDVTQHDTTGKHARSIDVIVTREPADEDEDGKRPKLEEVTVEILFIEIPSLDDDASNPTKKTSRETTSTTNR